MTFDISAWLSLNPGEALVLNFFLPFIVSFFTSLLIYSWIHKTAGSLSPTTASILSAPILGVAYHTFVTRGDFIHNTFENIMLGIMISAIFFAPIVIFLPPLLAIYLRRVFRQANPSGLFFSAGAAACLFMQAAWLYFWLNHPS